MSERKPKSDAEKKCDIWLERIISSTPDKTPDTIYHYSNAPSLLKILGGGKMYATDHRFLNDKSEFSHGIEKSKKIMLLNERNTKDKGFKDFLSNVKEYVDTPSEARIFVISFSSRKDDLSQWRGYANDGEGFTIGLDSKAISDIGTNNKNFRFGKVSYLTREFESNVTNILEDFYILYKENLGSTESREDIAGWCEATLSSMCAFHKHNSFNLEREWRIACYVSEKCGKEINVRNRGNYLIPFIELNLQDSTGKIPLSEIGIGPAFKNSSTRQAVLDCCNLHGYSPDIYDANTPYSRI